MWVDAVLHLKSNPFFSLYFYSPYLQSISKIIKKDCGLKCMSNLWQCHSANEYASLLILHRSGGPQINCHTTTSINKAISIVSSFQMTNFLCLRLNLEPPIGKFTIAVDFFPFQLEISIEAQRKTIVRAIWGKSHWQFSCTINEIYWHPFWLFGCSWADFETLKPMFICCLFWYVFLPLFLFLWIERLRQFYVDLSQSCVEWWELEVEWRKSWVKLVNNVASSVVNWSDKQLNDSSPTDINFI
jgi:hypothetical protein